MSRSGQSPQRDGATAGGRIPLLLGCVIAAAAILAYGNSLSGPFVFDDLVSIVDNGSIRHLAAAWLPPHGQGVTVAGRPILNLSFALNYAIGGTRVWGYHAANLLIHCLGGMALFGILRRTAGPGLTGAAFFASLLWTVHPLQTEAVTYVSQRAESMMGLFYLLTLYCFIRYATADETLARSATPGKTPASESFERTLASECSGTRKRFVNYWGAGSIICCLLGMATKEVMVSAPLMVLVYDRIFVAGSFGEAWRRRRGYYLALAATWLVLAGLVAANGGNRGGSVGFGTGISWTAYALTQFPAIVRYLRLVFWPHPLVFDYGAFWITRPETVLPDALVVLGLIAGTLWALRYRPPLGFLGLLFLAVLAPTSLLPGPRQMMAEHRMYLPLAAALAAVIFAARIAAGRRQALFGAAAAALAAISILATRARNADYRSDLALWGDTVARRPGNVLARNNFGNALRLAGRLPEAVAQYQAGLRIEPDNAELHDNLGGAWHELGRTHEAIAELQAVVRITPDFPGVHGNLGSAWEEAGQPAKAAAEFTAALRLRPDDAETHLNLGNALVQTGRIEAAIAEYRTALRIRPASADAANNLGNALDQAGRVEEAIAAYRAALRLAPGNADILQNLGLELERARDAPGAGAQTGAAPSSAAK